MQSTGRHYFTFAYGVLNVKTRQFCFVSAGNPGPLVVHADGTCEAHDVPAVPIGMFPESEYEDTVIQLQQGDRLYLHSDGLYEERHPDTREEFGRMRMQEALGMAAGTPFPASLDKLIESVIQWHGNEALSDDVAVIGCSIDD